PRSVALFTLVRNVGRGRPSRASRAEGAHDPWPWMFHPRSYHRRCLVAGTGAGPRAAGLRRGGFVHHYDRRDADPNLGGRMGPTRACCHLPSWPSRRCARKGVALLGLLRSRVRRSFATRGASLAVVLVHALAAFSRARWMKGQMMSPPARTRLSGAMSDVV